MGTPGLQLAKKDLSKGNLLKSLFLLLIGSRRHCRVVGNSMRPAINKGDLIIYIPFKDQKDLLTEGLVVVLKHPIEKENLIVKRISKIDCSEIEVLGDNESISIDSRQFGKIHKNQIQGIVETIISKDK